MKDFVIKFQSNTQKEQLNNAISANVAGRIKNSNEYSTSEIEKIIELNKKLIPDGTEVSENFLNSLRSLCTLSQQELKPSNSIKSHRKILGPVIVFFKKASFPFIKTHLKEPFESLQEFSSRAVSTIASQQVEIERLKKQKNS